MHALNKWRETPLLTAANHGQAGAVEALLNADADPCKCTDTGWSPLSIAAYKGHDDVVKLLLEVGEAPTEEEDPTLSALLQAATKGLPGTVKLLLHHGADHTVTTKKGDTALSILVEQNLIDAAVDMVTEYKASVPRCSRDRKKVQRARLLINLRVKQQQREGKNIGLVEDEDETDEEDMIESNTPQHDGGEEEKQSSNSSQKNKKKKKKKKMSAEQQAKAAEEALLLELEQEDAKKQEEEELANKKSAKKRKKKERERQQKKEQEEQRIAEEREKAEKLRKEQQAREAAEKAERERLAAIRRKEEEEEAKRRLEALKKKKEEEERLKAQQEAQERKASNGTVGMSKIGKQAKPKAVKQPNQPLSQPSAQRATPGNPARPAVPNKGLQAAQPAQKPIGKNRGWETKPMKPVQEIKPKPIQPQTSQGSSGASEFPKHLNGQKNSISGVIGVSSQAPTAAPAFSSANDFPSLLGSQTPIQSSFATSTPVQSAVQPKPQFDPQHIEHPAVALFRRDKLNELFQRCAMARNSSDPLSAVSEETVKKVVYRWIVRASHQSSPYVDPLIPSWADAGELTAFFQRQFISEGRKNSSHGVAIVGMEALKEAGSALSALCQTLVKELTSFQQQLTSQLHKDWTDSAVGMTASDFMQNGRGSMIVVDWANRAQVYLPSLQFTKMRDHYVGPASRFLTALFAAKMRYETKSLVFAGTSMDFRLPPETQSVLASKAAVSAEVFSDPFNTISTNMFWGQFLDVDHHFGGLKPFGSGEMNEEILSRRGGAVAVMPPLDSMVTSLYVRRMVDLMFSNDSIPLSFTILFRAECFLDSNGIPTLDDLYGLDPRLRDTPFVRRFEQLLPGKHFYYSDKSSAFEVSLLGSAYVLLQNDAGRATYGDASTAEVVRSLSGGLSIPQSQPSLLPSNPFSNDNLLASDKTGIGSSGSFFDVRPAPVSPIAPQTITTDFGPVGGSNITSNPFAIGATDQRRAAPRRGRLFDLVDDGDEDALNDVDVVSGMLGNLNMDLFQNPVGSSSQDIDIEAISLMGIGAPPSTNGLQPRNNHGQFR